MSYIFKILRNDFQQNPSGIILAVSYKGPVFYKDFCLHCVVNDLKTIIDDKGKTGCKMGYSRECCGKVSSGAKILYQLYFVGINVNSLLNVKLMCYRPWRYIYNIIILVPRYIVHQSVMP
jgi:hypothetical protein